VPKVARLLLEAEPDLLAFYGFRTSRTAARLLSRFAHNCRRTAGDLPDQLQTRADRFAFSSVLNVC
jgi:hypothetical protein